MTADWLHRLAETAARLPAQPDRQWIEAMRNGTMRAGLYAPRGADDQTPHDQDEVYVVVAGSGIFLRAGERQAFGSGDFLFVPAGMEHRFEAFSDDFAAWAVFWGAKGGEG